MVGSVPSNSANISAWSRLHAITTLWYSVQVRLGQIDCAPDCPAREYLVESVPVAVKVAQSLRGVAERGRCHAWLVMECAIGHDTAPADVIRRREGELLRLMRETWRGLSFMRDVQCVGLEGRVDNRWTQLFKTVDGSVQKV